MTDAKELVCLLRGEPADSGVWLGDAADLIERQAAAIEKAREALSWAIAEIEGRTFYSDEEQFENCIGLAYDALSDIETRYAFEQECG